MPPLECRCNATKRNVGEPKATMAPVWFPDLRYTGRLVDVNQFAEQVHAKYEGTIPPEAVHRTVTAVARWMRTIIAEAGRHHKDPAEALQHAYDTAYPPDAVRAMGMNDAPSRNMVRFIGERMTLTTVRELPFWGCDRIRRANRLFAQTYPVVVDSLPRRRRRHVTFGAVRTRLLPPT